VFHMIIDNIEAYRRAVQDTTVASIHARNHSDGPEANPNYYDDLRSCTEEERVRYQGLISVISIAIKEAAAEQPHNPFSINDDVNQPDKPPVRPSPPPPRREE